jgi:hypothetical protein
MGRNGSKRATTRNIASHEARLVREREEQRAAVTRAPGCDGAPDCRVCNLLFRARPLLLREHAEGEGPELVALRTQAQLLIDWHTRASYAEWIERIEGDHADEGTIAAHFAAVLDYAEEEQRRAANVVRALAAAGVLYDPPSVEHHSQATSADTPRA